MSKVAYNACYGGFSLSPAAVRMAQQLSADQQWKSVNESDGLIDDIPRHDPVLVRVIEELGEAANGSVASLQLAELPSGTSYRIDEHDGMEKVCTVDDYEWSVVP